MKLIDSFKQTKFAAFLKKTPFYEIWSGRKKSSFFVIWSKYKRRIRTIYLSGKLSLVAGLVIDKLDVVITTKCNLQCEGCSHLMPYYKNPGHLDKDRVIASIRELAKAVDWFGHFNILGGEPFLSPDLKYIMEEIPVEKCHLVQVLTNATIVPKDPELFDVMRRKGVHVVITPYPSNEQTREQLIAVLEREHVAWNYYYPRWTDHGEPCHHHRSPRELQRQFAHCTSVCKNLLDGRLYYCFRCAHIYDLGFCQRLEGEAVDLLKNTTAQNRKQLRRLLRRRKPFTACQYCLRGTNQNVGISRGK